MVEIRNHAGNGKNHPALVGREDGKQTGTPSGLRKGPKPEGCAAVLMDRFEKRIRQI